MADDSRDEVLGELEELPWHQFLVGAAPGRLYRTDGMVEKSGLVGLWTILTPEIVLPCDDQRCNGDRLFEYMGPRATLDGREFEHSFLTYRCKNCEETEKTFAVLYLVEQRTGDSAAAKFGEWPPFGPHVPARVISLVGPDREMFIKGRRAESQGMGIGAFAYYRRVVENQKGRLLEKVIAVAEKLDGTPEALKLLRQAAAEKQFSKALEIMKPAIPDAIRIRGHNPLQLLHSALSSGLHAKSDAECLELATTIRVVLSDLADRIGQALRDQSELHSAVGRLLGMAKSSPTDGPLPNDEE